jgi:hypothetical protein
MSEADAVPLLMTENAIYLKAISAGAVFFGACSYIGNAPNFMVRSISEEAGTPMPSFFGYILKYTLIYLVPCYVVVTLIFVYIANSARLHPGPDKRELPIEYLRKSIRSVIYMIFLLRIEIGP